MLGNIFLVVLLLFFCSNLKSECLSDNIGLCTEGTTTEITNTEVIETIVQNLDSGDLLDGSNNYVTTTKEGDMDFDWGGQGSASMPSGNSCYGLGTDRCAEITDSNLTTFYQEIDISSLDINNGGRTNYTIKVDKQDPQDNIYMKIIGKNGNTEVFSGTDILSASGVTTGYQSYSSGFDFGGFLNTLTIEVGGRDINLAVGPVFDDVTINVLYNVVTTIVNQQIQELEEFLVLDYGQNANDVAEMIFDNNEVTDDFNFQPIEEPQEDISFETVEIELQEFEMEFMTMEMDMEMPGDLVMPMETVNEVPIEIQMVDIEMEIEMEMDLMPELEIEEAPIVVAEIEEPEVVEVEPSNEPEEAETEEPKIVEAKEIEKPQEEVKEETKPEPSAKQKAANKIVKKMGDKGRYDSQNQIKTLIVMQVLSNTNNFFDDSNVLQDTQGFFNNKYLVDAEISDNNLANYLFYTLDSNKHDSLVNSQFKR